MKSITINFKSESIAEKVIAFLEQFKTDGVEIVSKEDLDDLKLLKATRNESSISFGDFLKDENKHS
jgi:hypothetical protein